MSSIRVSNIEAKANPSSPTVDEKLKVTDSQGRVLMQVDGKTSGITTVGINTTGNTFTVNANNGVTFAGIVTASGGFSGNITGNVTGNINSTGVTTVTTLNATSIVGVTTAGITTAYIGSVNNGPISGSKNRIINGDFEIWQRGTSVTYLNNSTTFYLADRWSGTAEYQNARHQRVSIADTASGMVTRYALRASSSTTGEVAGGTRITTGQKIENVNMYDLRGKTITASFWVKFSAATVSSSTATAYGNWNAFFGFPTSVDASFATTSPITAVGLLQLANGSLPTTWTKYSITATVPSNAGNIDLRFQFDNLGNTASADTVWYDITQVQLEEGPVASVFERRSYGQELALCQRYFEKSYDVATAPGTITDTGVEIQRTSTTEANYNVRFRVSKRTGLTIVVYSNVTGASGKLRQVDGTSSPQDVTANSAYVGENGFRIYANVGSSGAFCSTHWTASAEL